MNNDTLGSVITNKNIVTAICGPPGSGKTTYVSKHSKWGDLIVDLDAIYVSLSGLPWHERPKVLLPIVLKVRDTLYQQIICTKGLRHAWIITTGASASDREKLRERFNASIIVLETSVNECMRRMSSNDSRGDRNRLQQWRLLVEKWWRNYSRLSADTIIKA